MITNAYQLVYINSFVDDDGQIAAFSLPGPDTFNRKHFHTFISARPDMPDFNEVTLDK